LCCFSDGAGRGELNTKPWAGSPAGTLPYWQSEPRTNKQQKEKIMDLAIQGAIWLGAGVTLVMLLARRRKRRTTR